MAIQLKQHVLCVDQPHTFAQIACAAFMCRRGIQAPRYLCKQQTDFNCIPHDCLRRQFNNVIMEALNYMVYN